MIPAEKRIRCALMADWGNLATDAGIRLLRDEVVCVDGSFYVAGRRDRTKPGVTAGRAPPQVVGHKGHDEVVGVLGEAPARIRVVETQADAAALRADFPAAREVAVLSQTTVSQDMVEARLADLRALGLAPLLPDRRDICTATQERQDAVRALASQADRFLVLGSRTSSNSKRLAEVAQSAGCPATLIASPDELDGLDLSGVRTLALTSGASTPESLLDALRARLESPRAPHP